MDSLIDQGLAFLANQFPEGSFLGQLFNWRAMIALFLVGSICGLMGAMVVGSRMAFFSDALAHCAFAGVSIGFLVFDFFFSASSRDGQGFWGVVTPLMIVFGALVGLGIAQVRHRTRLGGDTVIGVFFAGSLGLAAALSEMVRNRRLFNLEEFLFGNPLQVRGNDLLWIFGALLLVCVFLFFNFNGLVLGSFNSSLAKSRKINHTLLQHLFIIVLAIVVNLSLRLVGVLLINALLIVPAATAMNWSRNLRQMFWLTLLICLLATTGGQFLSWESSANGYPLGTSGAIVLLTVFFFVLSLLFLREGKGSRVA